MATAKSVPSAPFAPNRWISTEPRDGDAACMTRLGMAGRESFGEAAAAIEFVLEGLYLIRRLSKDSSNGTTTYRT